MDEEKCPKCGIAAVSVKYRERKRKASKAPASSRRMDPGVPLPGRAQMDPRHAPQQQNRLATDDPGPKT